MAGHCLEAHVAAANRADRGDNQDPAVGAASEGGIDEGSRDQTTQRLGRTTKRCRSRRRTISSAQLPVRATTAAIPGPWYPASPMTRPMKGEQPARLAQQRFGAVAVLHVGRVDHHGEQQAGRVGQQMALAPGDLLGRVMAGWVERTAPSCAACAVWLSMIAVVGPALRPTASRAAA